MRIAPLLPLACLSACGGGGAGTSEAIDVDAAANRAQHDIANYAAIAPDPTTPPRGSTDPNLKSTATPLPGSAVVPGVVAALADQRTPEAAAAVVRAYAAALSSGRYEVARQLWRRDGAASGMTADAFAASFRNYVSISGEVGRPYDADAGAGQRFVSVPLTLSGDLRQGGRFVLAGPVILHRVGDGIDTQMPTDHLWRIERADLKLHLIPGAVPAGTTNEQ